VDRVDVAPAGGQLARLGTLEVIAGQCDTRSVRSRAYAPASTSCASIRTSVSTNVLSVVPLVTGRRHAAAEMEPLLQERDRAPPSLLAGIVFADKRFDLLGEQAADRGVALGCQHLRLREHPLDQPVTTREDDHDRTR
jgi:hypothetical protein